VLGTRFGKDLSFQARLTLVAATAVAVTVIVSAVIIYWGVRTVVMDGIDSSLKQRADQVTVQVGLVPAQSRAGSGVIVGFERELTLRTPPDPDGNGVLWQSVGTDGTTKVPSDQVDLPVSARDRHVAAGDTDPYYRDEWVRGAPYRIYTFTPSDPRASGVAVEAARPLGPTYAILDILKIFLGVVSLAGIVLAALLGRLISQAALGPLHRLTRAVDHVTATRDMTSRVPDEGRDELGRLGSHFNQMLAALDQSLRMQRQLVADASHELRTPLASMRTNVEVLQRSPELRGHERERLLTDVIFQIEQLTKLIGDLIDLARGDQTPEEREEVRVDWIVAAAVERAAINWPTVRFDSDLHELVVEGQARRLDRAISNLLDNAGKWSPSGGVVDVQITDHDLVVRDHGPGIDPSDLPYVFDRFWRAPAARGMPGSGLGLSIVRQVADAHGAIVTAELPLGGGTLMRLRFANSKGPLSRT